MKYKCDPNHGKRFMEELYRVFPKKTNVYIANALGCERKTLNYWGNGVSPSSIFLESALAFGVDVEYVLTGRRKNNPPEFLAELEEEYD